MASLAGAIAAIAGGSASASLAQARHAMTYDVWLTGDWNEDFTDQFWRRTDVRPMIRANLANPDAPVDNPYGTTYGNAASLNAGNLDADAAARQLYDVLSWTIDGIAAATGREPEAIEWVLWLPHVVASLAYSWSSGSLAGEPRNGRRAVTNPSDRLADVGALIWPNDSLARYSPFVAQGVPLAYAHALDVLERFEALRLAGTPVYHKPSAMTLDDEDVILANADYNTTYASMIGDARAGAEALRGDGATLDDMLADAPAWTGANVFASSNAHMRWWQERSIEIADYAFGGSIVRAAREVWGANLPASNWETVAVDPSTSFPVFIASRPLELVALRSMSHQAPQLYGLPGSTYNGNKAGWLADMGLTTTGSDVLDWQAVNGAWIARRIAAIAASGRPFNAWFRPADTELVPFGSAPRRTSVQVIEDMRAFRIAGGSTAILWGGTSVVDWTPFVEGSLA